VFVFLMILEVGCSNSLINVTKFGELSMQRHFE